MEISTTIGIDSSLEMIVKGVNAVTQRKKKEKRQPLIETVSLLFAVWAKFIK